MNILHISFQLNQGKINREGLAPLRCRITYKGCRKEFSIGIYISKNHWEKNKQKIINHPETDNYNNQLSLIRQKLNQAFLFLQVTGSDFSVNDIYRKFKGEKTKDEFGLIQAYHQHLHKIKKLVGKDIQPVTYQKYVESGKHLQDYIKWKFQRQDLTFKELKSNFIDDYEYYLKTEKNFSQNTLNKAIQRFRKVIQFAVAEDYIFKDPFLQYKPKTVKKEVVFLTSPELKNLETHNFEIERLQRVRDMFVFCCYTGLGFREMTNLKKSDVVVEFDGKLWIHIFRNKTGRLYKVPLLPKAREIMDKYSNYDSDRVLPKMYNQNFNGFLKEIAAVCGIKKHLTHHIARKTFATTILLFNDVPMEIVSKLLGHSKIQTTQDHYGHILDEKVSEQMQRIANKLK